MTVTNQFISKENTLRLLDTFEDLVTNPSLAILSTFSANGFPHATVVWFDFDGEYFRINTMKEFQKEKNIKRNPLVNLLIYNPENTLRSVEVRGKVVEMIEKGALEHLNSLCFNYSGGKEYFGDCIAKEFEKNETPLLCKIKPLRIITSPKVELEDSQ